MNPERWFNWIFWIWFSDLDFLVLTRYWFLVVPSDINRHNKNIIHMQCGQEHLCFILTLQHLPGATEIYESVYRIPTNEFTIA